MQSPPIKLFSGTGSRYLAEKIADSYGQRLGQSNLQNFADGEFQPSYEETVRGDYVFIIQSTFQPTDNLMELLLMIDAARRASAYKIVAVVPYFGYARQDRKDRPRVSIGAKLMANIFTAAGVDRIITMDLHAPQIQAFYDVPVDHLFASAVFVPYLRKLALGNLTIASPDVGGSKRANAYAHHLGTDLIICHKTRFKANEVEHIKVIGDAKGKDVVLIDDMIDTAGTITKAAAAIHEMGANSVRVFATHPLLSSPAIERIREAPIEELVVTDTIPLRHECDKIRVLSVANVFADVIDKIYSFKSISSNFLF